MHMKSVVKKIKTKLSEGKGFTFAELLFSILILMLSTTIIIQCFNLGLKNIVRETRASEAQLLCSALTSSIQNELTYARDVKLTTDEDGKKYLDTYFSSARRMGANSRIRVYEGEIYITNKGKTDTINLEEDIPNKVVYPLVESANYKADHRAGVGSGGKFLTANMADIQYDSAKGLFYVSLWVDDGTDTEENALAYSKFSVKPLVAVKTTP